MKKILKFYSNTCTPCKVMSKRLEELNDVADIQEVDIMDDNNQSLIEEWKPRTIPTIVVLDEDNNFIGEFRGIVPIEKIRKVL